jgi:hypothetical protein
MLAQLLERRGVGGRVVTAEAVQPTNLAQLETDGVRIVCLSYMNEDSMAHARYLIRRLRRKLPAALILVAFWMAILDEAAQQKALERAKADFLATSLRDAIEQILDCAQEEKTEAMSDSAAMKRNVKRKRSTSSRP